MATGDSKLSICSDALIMLGASPLSSFSEGTDAAQICDRLYDNMLQQLLVKYPWSFTLKKTQLARLVDAPASEWTHAYALPADLIGSGARALFTTASPGASPQTTGWEVYSGQIFTDFTEVHIDYQVQPDETVMPSYFVQLVKYYTAWHIAEAVTDQISKAQYFQSLAVGSLSENMRGGMMRQAMQIDGGSKPVAGFQDFPLVTARAS